MITGKNSLQKIDLMNLYQYIVLVVFCTTLCLPSKIHSQCNPPFDIPFELVELDSIINYTFISSNTGVQFTQPLHLNLPLCPDYAEEGAGCTQVELPAVDYNGLGLGYSGAFLQVFWRDIWENQLNNTGDLISEDSDLDGCAYDNADDPFALTEYGISEDGDNNPFYNDGWAADWDGNGTMDFAIVIRYYCEDDPITAQNEEEFVCDCQVEFFSINESNDFDLTYDQSQVSCYDFSNASINTSSSGGTGPFVYNWDFIVDEFNADGVLVDEGALVEGLEPGLYALTVEDLGIPCTYLYDFIVTEPDSLSIQSVLATDPSCFGFEDGSAQLVVAGGTPPYSQEELINLGEGFYELLISDANGCEASTSFNLTAPLQIEIESTVSDYTGYGVSCNGDSDGFIEINSVSGGSEEGYTYLWSNGNTNSIVTDLSPGFYSVVVEDSAGCQEIFDFEITEPEELDISSLNSDFTGYGVSCNGANDGSINVTVTGGAGNYTYLWSNGATTEDLNNIGVGTYSVIATDLNGCSIQLPEFEITQTEAMTISETHSDYTGYGISCNGATDGFIDITVEGGTGIYTYLWSTGQTTEDLNDIGAGTYLVTAFDENDCAASIEVIITQADEIVISIDESRSNLELDCGNDNSGSIAVLVSGGSGILSYGWSNGETGASITNLSIGTYSITITDENDCIQVSNFDVTAPGGLIVSDPIISYCDSYDIISTENIECSGTLTINEFSGGTPPFILEVNSLDGSFSSIIDPFNDSSLIQTELCNNDYTVTITDDLGCQISTSFSIIYGENIELEQSIFDDGVLSNNGVVNICSGEGSLVTAQTTGGSLADTSLGEPYTYIWIDVTNGDTILTDTPSASLSELVINSEGDYLVVTTNQAGCSVESSFSVILTENLNINAGLDAECPGQDSYLYVIGEPTGGQSPYNYSWYYDFNSNGLDDQDNLIISGPDETFVGVLDFGTYYVVVTDALGCTVTQSLTLNWSLDIGLDIESTETACFGICDGSVTLIPDGSISSFSFDDWLLYYSIADIDGDGINNLNENGLVLDNDIDGDGVLNDDDDDIDGDGILNENDSETSISQYSVFIQSNSFTINDLCAGEYYLLGLSINGDGCETLIDYFEIPGYEDVIIEGINTSNISCYNEADGSVEILFSGGSNNQTYNITNNGNIISTGDAISPVILQNLGPGLYDFTIIDSECGDIQDNFTIIEPSEIIISIDSILSDLICFGDTDGFIDLNVSGGVGDLIFSWSTGQETLDIFDLSADVYTLTVTDSTGCQGSFTQEILEPEEFTLTYEYGDVICYGSNDGFVDVEIVGPGTFTYSWSDNNGEISTEQDLINIGPGLYTLNVFSDSGCGDETIEVEIEEPDEIQINLDDIESSICFSFEFNNAFINITATGGTGDYIYSWVSDGAGFISSNEDISNLSAGFYSITVTDENGCQATVDQIQITEPSPIELLEDLDNDGFINSSYDYSEYVCQGECDGQVALSIQGGISPYLFELLNDSGDIIQQNNSGIFNGLCSGCYDIDIYDFNWTPEVVDGCFTSFNFCIEESSPSVNGVIVPAGCGTVGTASFEFLGDQLPYNISLSLDGSLFNEEIGYSEGDLIFENLPSGNYELVLEDNLGCLDSYVFDIENIVNVIEVVDFGIFNPLCWDDNGSANIEITNSFVSNNQNSFGTITIALDNNGDCILNDNESVIGEFEIDNVIGENIIIPLSDLVAGDYVVLIEDNFGCFINSCFSINAVEAPNPAQFFASVDALCSDASGSAYVSSDPLDVGGTPFSNSPFYIVEWFNDLGQPVTTVSEDALIATSLYAGEYTVTITDSNNCIFEHVFIINEPPSVLVSGISYSDSECYSNNFNECSGEIIVQPFGGVGGMYIVNIGNENGVFGLFGTPISIVPGINDTYVFENVCPGEYIIQVSDADIVTESNVCPPVYEEISIAEPDLIEWTIVTDPLPCNGDVIIWSEPGVLNGNYYVYEGGVGPPDLYWFEQGVTMVLGNELDINNLGPGTYDLMSIDAAGCITYPDSYTILETPELQSELDSDNSSLFIYCAGDSTGVISFDTYGGTPDGGPYTYLWSFNGDYLPEYNNMDIVTNLPSGSYEVVVNDENDCGPIIHNINIQETDLIDVDITVSNVLCFGDSTASIDLIVNSDTLYTYNWTTYDSENAIIESYVDTTIINYLYQWSGFDVNGNIIDLSTQNNNQDLTDLPVGNYSFSISIDVPIGESFISTCTYSNEVEVTQPDLLEFIATEQSNISCYGLSDGEIDVSITGGQAPYSYSWSGIDLDGNIINLGSQASIEDLNNLVAGQYILEVSDFNGCPSINDTVLLTEPDLFLANLTGLETVVTNARCSFGNSNSGQIAIHLDSLFSQLDGGTPPYTNPFLVNDFGEVLQNSIVIGDTIFFSNLEGGEYEFYVNDALDCSQSFTAFIGIDNQQLIDLEVVVENANCGFNGSLFVTSLSNFNGIPPYSVEITNISDPQSNYSFVIDSGFDYNSNDWNNNLILDYDPDIDGDGYINSEDGDIDGDGNPNYNDNTPYGEPLEDIDGDGVLNFDSDFNQSDFGWYNALAPGEYEVHVVDSVGCEGYAGPFLISSDISSFNVTLDPGNCYWELNNECDSLNYGSIILDLQELNTLYPYSVYVDGVLDTVLNAPLNDYNIEFLQAGTAYSISLLDANGCEYSNNGEYYEVPFLSELNIDIVGFCPECQESNNGGFAYTYLEINDEVLSGINPDVTEYTISPINGGDISIYLDAPDINCELIEDSIIYDNNLLTDEYYVIDEQWLNNIPNPNVLVGYHQEYLQLLSDTSDYVVGGLSYGNYDVTVVDEEYGCKYTLQIDISNETCKNEFGSQQWNNCLFIPSVFTPNSDGINDLWDIYNIELYEPDVTVKIFNRWGQLVYESYNTEYSQNLWNGINMKGENVEIATYYYVIEVGSSNNQKKYTGYVVVKR